MKISGVIKTSLIDYPGFLTTTIFTQGCNFKCPYCHNPELIPEESENEEYMELNYFWKFLQDRNELIDAVTITGGEPTLQADIVEFISGIKARGFKVKLDTNGSNPKVVKNLLTNKLIDYIALDIKSSLENYNWFSEDEATADRVRETIKIIKNADIEHEFRTTVVPGLHDKKEMKKIGNLVDEDDKYVVQNFKPAKTYNNKYENKKRFSDERLQEFANVIEDKCKLIQIKN